VHFIKYLTQFRENRGALANLRAAFSETRRHRAWPLLGGFTPAIGNARYELVAALWAADAESHGPDQNLGATLHKLAAENNSFEGRFKRVLTADREEVPNLVAPLVRAAQAKGAHVHYARLLSDLLCWGDYVKVEWARTFWGSDASVSAASAGVDPVLFDTPEDETAATSKEAP